MFNLYNFPNKLPNEKIEVFLHRHWIVFFRTIIVYIAATILPVAFYFLLKATTSLFDNEGMRAIFVLGGSLYSLYLILFFFGSFLDYYLDVWIVTNKRVLNIEQSGLFSRVIAEKELVKMQDITSEVIGFWRTMFDYGEVYLQTAAEKERFIFKEVPHPRNVAKKITLLLEVAQNEERQEVIDVWKKNNMANGRPDTEID